MDSHLNLDVLVMAFSLTSRYFREGFEVRGAYPVMPVGSMGKDIANGSSHLGTIGMLCGHDVSRQHHYEAQIPLVVTQLYSGVPPFFNVVLTALRRAVRTTTVEYDRCPDIKSLGVCSRQFADKSAAVTL